MAEYPEPTWTVARVFHSEIVDDYIPERIRALREIDLETVKDATFRDVAEFVQSLTDDQVRAVATFARMIGIDAVASILGLVGGSGYAEGLEHDFKLAYAGHDVTQYILDAFLRADEISLER